MCVCGRGWLRRSPDFEDGVISTSYCYLEIFNGYIWSSHEKDWRKISIIDRNFKLSTSILGKDKNKYDTTPTKQANLKLTGFDALLHHFI